MKLNKLKSILIGDIECSYLLDNVKEKLTFKNNVIVEERINYKKWIFLILIFVIVFTIFLIFPINPMDKPAPYMKISHMEFVHVRVVKIEDRDFYHKINTSNQVQYKILYVEIVDIISSPTFEKNNKVYYKEDIISLAMTVYIFDEYEIKTEFIIDIKDCLSSLVLSTVDHELVVPDFFMQSTIIEGRLIHYELLITIENNFLSIKFYDTHPRITILLTGNWLIKDEDLKFRNEMSLDEFKQYINKVKEELKKPGLKGCAFITE